MRPPHRPQRQGARRNSRPLPRRPRCAHVAGLGERHRAITESITICTDLMSRMQHVASIHGAGARAAGTPPTRCASRQRRSSGRQLAARPTCRAEQPRQGGRPGSAAVPPLPPPLLRAQAVDRRGLLALLAAANLALPAPEATAAPAARPVQPLPVPPLTETFTSPEVRPSLGLVQLLPVNCLFAHKASCCCHK